MKCCNNKCNYSEEIKILYPLKFYLIKIELYKQEMKDLEKEQENKSKMLKMKMVEHERAVAVLKANIDPEFYQWFDDYIEGVTTSTKAVLVELLKHVVSKGKLKNLKLTQSQYPLEDAVLTTLTRRRSSNLNDSTRLLKLLGLLASKERKPEARNTEINTEIRINASSVVKNTALMNSPVNGFVNRQKEVTIEANQKKIPIAVNSNHVTTTLPQAKVATPPMQPNGIVPYQLSGVSSASPFYGSTCPPATRIATAPTQSTSKQPVRMKMNMPNMPNIPNMHQNGPGFNFQYNMVMRYPQPPPPFQ